MGELRRTPIPRALHRPNLFLGGERELVLITAVICAGVAVSSLNLPAILAGLVIWSVLIGLFRMMAKADPMMSRIYLRQLHAQSYYPARSRPSREGLMMLALKHFRDKAKGVADLLNYAALIDEGIVLCKDGALLGGFFFRGPDTASATAEARNYLTARVNAALARLGSGYALWVEAVRLPSASYPDRLRSFFPDRITQAIDEERRRQFLAEGAHFESEHALILMYTPPLRRTSRIAELVYDDDDASAVSKPSGDAQIAQFKRALADLEDGLGDVLNMRRMASFSVPRKNGQPFLQDELINFLQFWITGVLSPIAIPPCAMYLDALLGGEELYVGDTPKIGGLTLGVLAIEGFPHESFPGLLDRLDGLAIAYRFSTRFIALDAHEALSELRAYRRKWRQWMRGFWSQVFKTSGGMVNEDASLMARQTEDAITDAQSGLLSFGYYTPVVVVMGRSRAEVLENARAIQRELRRDGFAARIETVNELEAWLGSLPGHVHPNVRRPLLHSLNLADLLPLSAAWPGLPENPSPLFPAGSPPLLHGATSGSTPFRLNLHVSHVGHTLIFGPTGAGIRPRSPFSPPSSGGTGTPRSPCSTKAARSSPSPWPQAASITIWGKAAPAARAGTRPASVRLCVRWRCWRTSATPPSPRSGSQACSSFKPENRLSRASARKSIAPSR